MNGRKANVVTRLVTSELPGLLTNDHHHLSGYGDAFLCLRASRLLVLLEKDLTSTSHVKLKFSKQHRLYPSDCTSRLPQCHRTTEDSDILLQNCREQSGHLPVDISGCPCHADFFDCRCIQRSQWEHILCRCFRWAHWWYRNQRGVGPVLLSASTSNCKTDSGAFSRSQQIHIEADQSNRENTHSPFGEMMGQQQRRELAT